MKEIEFPVLNVKMVDSVYNIVYPYYARYLNNRINIDNNKCIHCKICEKRFNKKQKNLNRVSIGIALSHMFELSKAKQTKLGIVETRTLFRDFSCLQCISFVLQCSCGKN